MRKPPRGIFRGPPYPAAGLIALFFVIYWSVNPRAALVPWIGFRSAPAWLSWFSLQCCSLSAGDERGLNNQKMKTTEVDDAGTAAMTLHSVPVEAQ
jgi:hypothetical protein